MYNKKGAIEQLGLIAITSFMLFMAGMLFVAPIMDSIAPIRTSLECASPADISDGAKITCLFVDAVVPYFIILILSIAGGAIISKFAI